MSAIFAFTALAAAVGARLYFGARAARYIDELPAAERQQLLRRVGLATD